MGSVNRRPLLTDSYVIDQSLAMPVTRNRVKTHQHQVGRKVGWTARTPVDLSVKAVDKEYLLDIIRNDDIAYLLVECWNIRVTGISTAVQRPRIMNRAVMVLHGQGDLRATVVLQDRGVDKIIGHFGQDTAWITGYTVDVERHRVVVADSGMVRTEATYRVGISTVVDRETAVGKFPVGTVPYDHVVSGEEPASKLHLDETIYDGIYELWVGRQVLIYYIDLDADDAIFGDTRKNRFPGFADIGDPGQLSY